MNLNKFGGHEVIENDRVKYYGTSHWDETERKPQTSTALNEGGKKEIKPGGTD